MSTPHARRSGDRIVQAQTVDEGVDVVVLRERGDGKFNAVRWRVTEHPIGKSGEPPETAHLRLSSDTATALHGALDALMNPLTLTVVLHGATGVKIAVPAVGVTPESRQAAVEAIARALSPAEMAALSTLCGEAAGMLDRAAALAYAESTDGDQTEQWETHVGSDEPTDAQVLGQPLADQVGEAARHIAFDTPPPGAHPPAPPAPYTP